MHRRRRLVSVALVCLAAAVTAACGSGASGPKPPEVSVVLDFVPNAVHVGLYTARAEHIDVDNGMRLDIQPPGSTSDPLKLVSSGKAEFGIVDLIDLALARQRGEHLVAVAAIVQRPTGSILTLADGPVKRPKDLEGRKVGLTGVPSDPAIVRSVIRADGGDPDRAQYVTIGFNAVQSLAAGSVAGSIGFWPADGVALERTGHPVRAFKLDDFGAPAFPELVLFTTDATLDRDPRHVARVVSVLRAGYDAAIADPERALDDLAKGARGVDREDAKAQLDRYLTIFRDRGQPWGVLDPQTIARFTAWLQHAGVTPTAVDPTTLARPVA